MTDQFKAYLDACFKLQGEEVVLGRMTSFKNLQSKIQAPEKVTNGVSKLGKFIEDEIIKLRFFLKTIQFRSCSIAQTYICLTSENFNGSKTTCRGSWITDSDTINHMT